MEYAKDEIFNITYNTKLNRLEINQKKWTSSIKEFFKKHFLFSIFLISFIVLSIVNFILIYNFLNIFKNV